MLNETQQLLYEKLYRDFGEQIISFLQDSNVQEIILNPDGQLWIDSAREGLTCAGSMSHATAFSIINGLAGIFNLIICAEHPHLETQLPHFQALCGQRFTGIIPPITNGPCFTIRKPNMNHLSLEDYVRSQRLTPQQALILQNLVKERKNILVCGGPGSGKTTLTNALIHAAIQTNSQQRFLILEDSAELQCLAPNCVKMLTNSCTSLRDLLRAAVRMRPDRIFIGEVRGAEAFDMLKAWNIGCPGGICTVHANSAEQGLQRIADLSMESGLNEPPWTLLLQTIDVIVAIVRHQHHKGFLERIVTVKGRHHGQWLFETLA